MKTHGHLLRVLGVGFGLAVIIGNTIGAGIFRAPGQIAEQIPAPAPYLLIWLTGGLYALLGAISLAELGTIREGQKISYDLERGQQGKVSAVNLKAA